MDNQITTTNADEIQSLNLQKVKQWYKDFSAFSKEVLKEGLDYGIIPGVSKPSLLKPGAEKLSLVYKLQPRLELTDKTVEIDAGFVSYSYKCTVYLPDGQVRGECEATCHSFEKKYLYAKGGERRSPEELMYQLNTIQKMAQKRAYVGAVLIATGASEFYTQDVEDMGLVEEDSPSAQTTKPASTQSQIDLSLLVMPFGKKPSDDAKAMGFVLVTINPDQAKTCGFNWNDQYDKGGKKYVLRAPDRQLLALLMDPETMKPIKGYQISKTAEIRIDDVNGDQTIDVESTSHHDDYSDEKEEE